MTFAAPLFAWLAGAVALATVAAHLLAWRRPTASPLPTARFAPERPVRVVARAVRPTDMALLAVRVGLVMLIGLALARPAVARERRGSARVLVVDQSRGAAATPGVAESARPLLRANDALVVFDSVAREVRPPSADSIGGAATRVTGSDDGSAFTAALIAAVRAAERLRREHDSVEILVVSPVTAHELDAATMHVRALWRGPLRVVRPRLSTSDSATTGRVVVRAAPDDPVVAALALIGAVRSGDRVRVVRDVATQADSQWAAAGGALVVWPAAAPSSWRQHVTPDTAYAVTAVGAGGMDEATVVAAFGRSAAAPVGRTVARWSDAEPAASEVALGAGCVRSVAIAVPVAGDLALTAAFRRFAERMAAPCAGSEPLVPASDSAVAALVAAPPSADARTGVPARPTEPPSRLAAWLLGGALALGLVELLVRRGESYVGP